MIVERGEWLDLYGINTGLEGTIVLEIQAYGRAVMGTGERLLKLEASSKFDFLVIPIAV